MAFLLLIPFRLSVSVYSVHEDISPLSCPKTKYAEKPNKTTDSITAASIRLLLCLLLLCLFVILLAVFSLFSIRSALPLCVYIKNSPVLNDIISVRGVLYFNIQLIFS